MPNRVAEVVILCEDDRHRQFVGAYLDWMKVDIRSRRFAINEAGGAGEQFVRERFELKHAEFQRSLSRRSAGLVVVVDADKLEVAARERQFPTIPEGEPCVIIIPKRHIETWVLRLGCEVAVDEQTDYHFDSRVNRQAIRRAAEALWRLTRHGSELGADLPPSISAVIPKLQRFERALLEQWNTRMI